ncbi:MAG TPA: hypothetical protein PLS03_17800, partial [Terrimicrobiaceae bacterium]|nr:hypothetical protein [Terrimicrobiaceae bacterium]
MRSVLALVALISLVNVLPSAAAALYEVAFSGVPLGKIPAGWRDLGVPHASPTWAVDGRGLLRVVWKGDTGLIVYRGALADGSEGSQFTDGTVSAAFQKTPDPEVFFGVVGRVQDAANYYGVRFSGMSVLELVRVQDGRPEVLASLPTRARYQEGETWRLVLAFRGPVVTGQVFGADGVEQARVDALEETGFASGAAGLQATNFAGAATFAITSDKKAAAALSPAEIDARNASGDVVVRDVVLPPARDVEKLNTPFGKLSKSYDVVVAGAGTGGWAAGIQAARMGAK